MKKEEFYFLSRDNETKIHAVKWIPDTEPVCILQVVHGMAEYVERYERLAKLLTDNGILVTGEDHLGHGKSLGADGCKGYFCRKDAATVVVRDVHRLKKTVQEQYPGIPYLIMGHSMGSFILRNYLCRYGTGIDGAVVMGTGMQPKAMVCVAKAVAKLQGCLLYTSRNRAVIVKSIPVESKGRNFPAAAPRQQPAIQYSWSSRAIKKKNHDSSTPSGGLAEQSRE